MFLEYLNKVIKKMKKNMGRFVTNHGTFSSSLLFWGLISFFTSLYALT